MSRPPRRVLALIPLLREHREHERVGPFPFEVLVAHEVGLRPEAEPELPSPVVPLADRTALDPTASDRDDQADAS